MAKNTESFEFTKLDGTNYDLWKFGVTFLLEAKDLIGHIDGSEDEPDKGTKLAEWKEWKKASSQSAVILLSSVEKSLHQNMINCSSPKQIWDKLKDLYGSLSEETNQSAWERLLRENNCLTDAENASSLALQIRALELKKNCYSKQKTRDRKAEGKKKMEEIIKQTKCAYCKELGHWIRECLKKPKSKKSGGEQSIDIAFVGEITALYLKTTENYENLWLSDSGVQMHMTFRRDFFQVLKAPKGNYFVKMDNDKVLKATGIGNIKIHETVDGQTSVKEMENVLLVPELKRNLFSIGAVIDKGISFHSYGNKCEIRRSDGKLITCGVRRDNLFRMLFQVQMPSGCNVANSVKNS